MAIDSLSRQELKSCGLEVAVSVGPLSDAKPGMSDLTFGVWDRIGSRHPAESCNVGGI